MAISKRARFFKAFLRSRLKASEKNIGNPAQQRKEMNASMALLVKPLGLRYQQQNIAGVRTVVARPKKTLGKKVLLYWHGGGYVIGRPENFKSLYGRLGKLLGATVYAPDYRLAPEHPYPAAIEDAVAVYQALLEHHAASDIYVAGDSAGGNLSLALCLKLKELGLPQPAALYLISPFADLHINSASIDAKEGVDPVLNNATLADWIEQYAPGHAPDDPLISVAYADYTGLPPMLIQVGEDEVLRDDSYAVERSAKAAGVEVELELGEELWHDWQVFAPIMPEANQALASAARWLLAH